MPYDPTLAARMRAVLHDHDLSEKQMFGGIAFMLGDAMGVGIIEDRIIVRTTPERVARLVDGTPGVRPMDFTGRPMKGWLYVEGPAIETDADLRRWCEESLDFVAALPQKARPQKARPQKEPRAGRKG